MARYAACLIPVLVAAFSSEYRAEPGKTVPGVRLEFTREVQNLRISERPLVAERPASVEDACSALEGPSLWGTVPHRLIGESVSSVEHFVPFVVAYPGDGATPTLRVDFNHDRRIDCKEQVPLLAHPQAAGRVFRTLTLTWPADSAPPRSSRYRLTVPSRADADPLTYWLDLVDVPVARWNEGEHASRWLLIDGNHDGIFAPAAGDGLLIDVTGAGHLNSSPYGGDFRSYHALLELPSGKFLVREVDQEGRFVVLDRATAEAVEANRSLGIGEVVPPVRCSGEDGQPIAIGGASGRYQLLDFWLSGCGGSEHAMTSVVPMLQRVPVGRLDVVGISMDDDEATFRRFVTAHAPGWPQCFTGLMLWDHPLARRFDLFFPSSFVLLDPAGLLIERGNGIQQLQASLEGHGLLPREADTGSR